MSEESIESHCGLECTLDEGRKVMGFLCGDSVCLEFTNKDVVTRIKLSHEAVKTVIQLYHILTATYEVAPCKPQNP